MSINVLVADDSATIQKVVSITLANESVNLISCESEGELLAKINEGNVQAVLLDFGLSQDKSGFDLITSILSINSSIKVLTMLPAFEQVDESKLSEVGSFGSIAKPFESSKFINVFREMISSIDYDESESETEDWIASSSADSNIGELDEVEETVDDFDPDQWVSNTSFTDHSQVTEASPIEAALDEDEKEPEMDHQLNDIEANELSETISDWGIDIPSPIQQQNAIGPSFPPIIDEAGSVTVNTASENDADLDDPFVQEEDDFSFDSPSDSTLESSLDDSVDEWSIPNQQFKDFSEESEEPTVSFDTEDENKDEEPEESTIYPEDDDLAYPDLGMDLGAEDNKLQDDFSASEKEEILNDDPIIFDDPAAVPASKRRPHVGSFDNLELASSDNSQSTISKRDSLDLEQEIQSDIDPDNFWDEDGKANSDEVSVSSASQGASPQQQLANIDIDKFFNEIKLELLDRVDRIVREVCEEKIEKVAWEVIPEIAENLIKKEIKSIQQDEEFR